MLKILGSTVALTVFALPLMSQAVFSQQPITQPSPTSNNVTGATNQPINQNTGAAQGNAGSAAIAPIQLQVVPGQAILLQVVSPNTGGTNAGANLGTNTGNSAVIDTRDLSGANTGGTNAGANLGTNTGNSAVIDTRDLSGANAGGNNVGNVGANQVPRTTNNAGTTATINPGGVLNLSTATSDRPTAGNARNAQNAGGNVQNTGVGNQATGNTNNVLNNIQPTNTVNGGNAASQGVNQNNQAFVAQGTLDAPLQQAVCAQNWGQATRIVNSAIAAAPATATQYRGQLEAYRNQLQTLQAANVRVPNWQQQCGG